MYRRGKKEDQAQAQAMFEGVVEKLKEYAAPTAAASGPQAAQGTRPQAGTAPPRGPAATIGARPASTGAQENTWAGFERRLSALMPAYRAAQGGPSRAQLQTLFGTANRFRDNADLPQAMKVLAELEALVKRVAASSGPAKEQAGASGTPQSTEAAWKNALAGTEPAYLQGLRARPSDAGRLRGVMEFAKVKAAKGDFPGALAALKALKDLLARSPAAAAGGKAPGSASAPSDGPAPGGSAADGPAVAFAKIKIQWNQAKQLVESQLDQLAADILADTDEDIEQFDEEGNEIEIESDDTEGAEKKLTKVLSRLNKGLGDALDAHYTAEPSARPALQQKIDAIANDYLAYVEDDPLIALVEENPYRKVAIRSVLRLPLTKLIEQIAAASAR
jgi:hypothetical protein